MVKRNKRTHSKQSLKTLYLEIWNERQHNCTVCKKYLWNEPKAHYFAHILSKGAYPNLKKKTSLFFVTIAIIFLTLGAVRMTKDLHGYTKKKRNSKENIFLK